MSNEINEVFKNLEKALTALEVMIKKPKDLDRANIDASIQRFEFSIELFWKLLKKIIFSQGRETIYPKDILKEAYAGHLINNEDLWIQMLNDRNRTSHTYNEKLADEIYENVRTIYYPLMKKTYDELFKKFS